MTKMTPKDFKLMSATYGKKYFQYVPPNLKLLNPTEIVSSITIFVGPKLFKGQHLVL